MRYASEHRQQTRARIIKEAAKEVRAKGPDGVAVAGLMARAGLTHGGFYAHFPSKEALVAEAIGAMFDDARGQSETLDTIEDPKVALREYLRFYLSRAHRDGRDRGCPLPALSGDIARSPGAAGERFTQGIDVLSGRLAALLARIGVNEPQAEARALLAQLVGAVSLARAVNDSAQSDAILRDTRTSIHARLGLDAA